MPYVTFDATEECRTGNKFIQYLTCKLIGHIFGHTYTSLLQDDVYVLEEGDFATILKEKPYYLSFVNIRIKGLFQRSDFFVPHRPVLLDLVYDPENNDYWNTGEKLCFVKDLIVDSPSIVTEKDICMSIRLDDFLHYPYHSKSDIPYPSYYKNILEGLDFQNLYIICDTVKEEWEWKYISHFWRWNPILLQGSFEQDCSLMRNCKRLIHSNSTLCWVMSFLSRGEKERYIPNTRHYPEQCLEAIEPGDKVFYPETMEHSELKQF